MLIVESTLIHICPSVLIACGGLAMSIQNGLDGVVVAQTRLSHVDGERGELIIAGQSVETLAGGTTFEEVCALLWDLPTVELGAARLGAFDRLPSLGAALEAPDAMDAMRAAIAHLPHSSTPQEVTAA